MPLNGCRQAKVIQYSRTQPSAYPAHGFGAIADHPDRSCQPILRFAIRIRQMPLRPRQIDFDRRQKLPNIIMQIASDLLAFRFARLPHLLGQCPQLSPLEGLLLAAKQSFLGMNLLGHIFGKDQDAADHPHGIMPGTNLPANPLHSPVGSLEALGLMAQDLAGQPSAMGLLPLIGYLRKEIVVRLAVELTITETIVGPPVLTKGTLILRDIDLLAEAAEITDVGLNVSVGFIDKELWRSVEPGTPAPARRLEACATLNERGLCCGVLMGPVVPFLSDSPAQLDAAVSQIAAAGATHVMPIVLHLRPGTREWFFRWLGAHHPGLVGRYLDLYGQSAYAPKSYQARIAGQVRELADRHGVGLPRPGYGHGRRPVPGLPAPQATRGAAALPHRPAAAEQAVLPRTL